MLRALRRAAVMVHPEAAALVQARALSSTAAAATPPATK
jgi:hypothetical protein